MLPGVRSDSRRCWGQEELLPPTRILAEWTRRLEESRDIQKKGTTNDTANESDRNGQKVVQMPGPRPAYQGMPGPSGLIHMQRVGHRQWDCPPGNGDENRRRGHPTESAELRFLLR